MSECNGVMAVSVGSQKTCREYHPLINFFRLRPELIFFLLCLAVFVVLIRTLGWRAVDMSDQFKEIAAFEMIELEIPVPKDVLPDVQVEETVEEETEIKKEDMRFGKDSGDHLNSAFAVTAPKLKVNPPAFPDSVKNLGIEGTVVVEFNIDENGKVVYGRIAKKLHPVIDALIFDWAKNASFYPALDPEGKAFKIKFFLPIRYRLE